MEPVRLEDHLSAIALIVVYVREAGKFVIVGGHQPAFGASLSLCSRHDVAPSRPLIASALPIFRLTFQRPWPSQRPTLRHCPRHQTLGHRNTHRSRVYLYTRSAIHQRSLTLISARRESGRSVAISLALDRSVWVIWIRIRSGSAWTTVIGVRVYGD